MPTVDHYLTDVVPRVYLPVLRDLLTDEELATLEWSIRAAPEGAALSGDARIGIDAEWLFIIVKGEQQNFWLTASMNDAEKTERCYSDLQDWISETRFGWGQLRGQK